MHFIPLMSIVASCTLELGLSLINDSSKDGGRWHHAVYGGSSSCPHRRTSLLRRKTKQSAQGETSTTVAAFSTAAIRKPNDTVLRRRKCSYVADTDCHYPPARGSINSSRSSIRNGNSFFSKSSWMLLSTSTLGRVNTARCSSSRLSARRLIDPHSDGGDDFFRRKDGSRIVDPTTQSKALQRQRRVTRPSMKTGAPPTGEDSTRIPRLRQRGGERVAGRGTAAAAAASAAAATSATGAPGAKTGAGIDQNDPLVKAWNSARVLNPSRDEFPLGGSQQQRKQRQGYRRREDFAGEEKASIPPGRIRAGVRDNGRRDASGRGGVRGRGRGRGRNTIPVGVYRGDDKVPWYIKEVQDKGLDKEGSFEQWWKTNLEPEAVVGSIKHMKVQELKAQLESMGLPTAGLKKAELSEKLAEGLRKFSLSDDNFQHAEVVDTTSQDSGLPNCFPQVYETLSESELEQLWRDSVRRKS